METQNAEISGIDGAGARALTVIEELPIGMRMPHYDASKPQKLAKDTSTAARRVPVEGDADYAAYRAGIEAGQLGRKDEEAREKAWSLRHEIGHLMMTAVFTADPLLKDKALRAFNEGARNAYVKRWRKNAPARAVFKDDKDRDDKARKSANALTSQVRSMLLALCTDDNPGWRNWTVEQLREADLAHGKAQAIKKAEQARAAAAEAQAERQSEDQSVDAPSAPSLAQAAKSDRAILTAFETLEAELSGLDQYVKAGTEGETALMSALASLNALRAALFGTE